MRRADGFAPCRSRPTSFFSARLCSPRRFGSGAGGQTGAPDVVKRRGRLQLWSPYKEATNEADHIRARGTFTDGVGPESRGEGEGRGQERQERRPDREEADHGHYVPQDQGPLEGARP